MTEYPAGSQILTSPPPSHVLHGVYPGRVLVLPDGAEVLMDKGLIDADAVVAAGGSGRFSTLLDDGDSLDPIAAPVAESGDADAD